MQFRSLFDPSAGLPDLAIPKFPQKSTEIFDSVDEVVYYIAGALCSALMKNSERCRKTDRARASLFGTFVGTWKRAKAEKSGLPIGLVDRRSEGALLYPSCPFFRVVRLLEHAYSELLTLQNMVSYGGGLTCIKKVRDLITKWQPFLDAFQECLDPVRECAEAAMGDFKSDALLLKVQGYYMRVRGKDAVKTIVR